jgi:hypothetical protein
MKKINYLNKIYEKNPANGNYILEISLDKYADVFNDWDHASYKKRDVDPQLAYFLEDCCSEIPNKYGLEICFYLPKQLPDKDKEKIIVNGIKTYYGFYTHSENKKLERSYEKIAIYLIVGFILLTLALTIKNTENSIFINTIIQGATVGGWVFLWEALSIFFFKMEGRRNTITIYERLSSITIYFKYDNLNENKQ